MAELQETTEQVTKLPRLRKRITLTAGQAIKDDPEILALSTQTVPAGKIAEVLVKITVTRLEGEEA